MVVVGQDLYCYKQQSDQKKHTLMHNLANSYVHISEEEIEVSGGRGEENIKYWPLKIILPPSKSRTICFETKEEMQMWQ